MVRRRTRSPGPRPSRPVELQQGESVCPLLPELFELTSVLMLWTVADNINQKKKEYQYEKETILTGLKWSQVLLPLLWAWPGQGSSSSASSTASSLPVPRPLQGFSRGHHYSELLPEYGIRPGRNGCCAILGETGAQTVVNTAKPGQHEITG